MKLIYKPNITLKTSWREQIKDADQTVRDINDPAIKGGFYVFNGEHFFLRIQEHVRHGNLSTGDFSLFWDCGQFETEIELDIDGDLIAPWPDDLFEADFHMRFSKPEDGMYELK